MNAAVDTVTDDHAELFWNSLTGAGRTHIARSRGYVVRNPYVAFSALTTGERTSWSAIAAMYVKRPDGIWQAR